MKLAIVGSRTFNDYDLFEYWIGYFGGDIIVGSRTFNDCDLEELVSGGAKGADSLAEEYAKLWGCPIRIFRPDWDKFGKQAGFIRNQQIVDNCDMVLAFWDGKSRGTKDTIDKARKAKKPTFIVYF